MREAHPKPIMACAIFPCWRHRTLRLAAGFGV